MAASDSLFLGFDLSTQQLKVLVVDDRLRPLNTYHVEFDQQFKEKYKVHKGVLANADSGEMLSPVLMWLDALDHVFGQMKHDGFPFENVRGMCGSGMQHGSVFWSKAASGALASMENNSSLADALADAFACGTSPNWQDHSTGQEIKDFEEVAGGPDELAAVTGSRAHYRFTGLQIRKLAVRAANDVYANTDRISLVSSFVASVLLGKITTIEEADACGMNVYDIAKSDYDDELLSVAAGAHCRLDGASESESAAAVRELRRKLGPVNPVDYKGLGSVAPYFVKKYGFSADAKVYSFTGDNLATIISLPVQHKDVLISLGTSTTVLLVTDNYQPSSQYHVFKHPTIKNAYMGMICYCNGALARENVRDELNKKHKLDHDSWDKFNEILDSSRSFDNKLGVYFPIGEIVPNAPAQTRRIQVSGDKVEDVEEWDVEEDVTSIVESQTISCRMRAGPMLCSSDTGVDREQAADEASQQLVDDLRDKFGEVQTDGKKQTALSLTSRPHKIFYVGGASRNKSIIRKMGSIMGATDGNYQVEIPNACALGGAFKASWSFACEEQGEHLDFNEYLNGKASFDDVEKFSVEDKWAEYFPAVGLLSKLEQELATN